MSFSTKTLIDNVLQNQITAKAHQIPKAVHVTNLTTDDQTAFTYDADSVLQDVELSMYDLNDDKTNLVAKATGIPTEMGFTQTKSTGVYDFAANAGIDLDRGVADAQRRRCCCRCRVTTRRSTSAATRWAWTSSSAGSSPPTSTARRTRPSRSA